MNNNKGHKNTLKKKRKKCLKPRIVNKNKIRIRKKCVEIKIWNKNYKFPTFVLFVKNFVVDFQKFLILKGFTSVYVLYRVNLKVQLI